MNSCTRFCERARSSRRCRRSTARYRARRRGAGLSWAPLVFLHNNLGTLAFSMYMVARPFRCLFRWGNERRIMRSVFLPLPNLQKRLRASYIQPGDDVLRLKHDSRFLVHGVGFASCNAFAAYMARSYNPSGEASEAEGKQGEALLLPRAAFGWCVMRHPYVQPEQ